MTRRGFDREFATHHLWSFPYAEQSQSTISPRAEGTFHIEGFAVVGYRHAS